MPENEGGERKPPIVMPNHKCAREVCFRLIDEPGRELDTQSKYKGGTREVRKVAVDRFIDCSGDGQEILSCRGVCSHRGAWSGDGLPCRWQIARIRDSPVGFVGGAITRDVPSCAALVADLASRIERATVWRSAVSRDVTLRLSVMNLFSISKHQEQSYSLPTSHMRSASWPELGSREHNDLAPHICSRLPRDWWRQQTRRESLLLLLLLRRNHHEQYRRRRHALVVEQCQEQDKYEQGGLADRRNSNVLL